MSDLAANRLSSKSDCDVITPNIAPALAAIIRGKNVATHVHSDMADPIYILQGAET